MARGAADVNAEDLEVERVGQGPPVLVHGSVVGPELTFRKQRALASAGP